MSYEYGILLVGVSPPFRLVLLARCSSRNVTGFG